MPVVSHWFYLVVLSQEEDKWATNNELFGATVLRDLQ